jgi:hypothetical protein
VAHRRVVVSGHPFSKLDAACRAFCRVRPHSGPPEPIRQSPRVSCRKSSSAVRNSAGRCRRVWSRKRSSSSRCRESNSRCCVRRAGASTAGSGNTPGSKARRRRRNSLMAAGSGSEQPDHPVEESVEGTWESKKIHRAAERHDDQKRVARIGNVLPHRREICCVCLSLQAGLAGLPAGRHGRLRGGILERTAAFDEPFGRLRRIKLHVLFIGRSSGL